MTKRHKLQPLVLLVDRKESTRSHSEGDLGGFENVRPLLLKVRAYRGLKMARNVGPYSQITSYRLFHRLKPRRKMPSHCAVDASVASHIPQKRATVHARNTFTPQTSRRRWQRAQGDWWNGLVCSNVKTADSYNKKFSCSAKCP